MIQKFRNASIKRKLIAITMLTSCIVLVCVSLTFVISGALTFYRGEKAKLSAIADIIGNNVSAAVTFLDQSAAEETLAKLSSNPHILAAYVITKDGRVFARYVAEGLAKDRLNLISKNKADLFQEADSTPYWDWDLDLEAAKKIVLDNQVIGMVIIQSDIGELKSRLMWSIVVVAIVMWAAFFIAYFLSSKLQILISRPILRLAQTMKAVSNDKKYSIRADKESNDEIGALIDGFNEMLEQIEARDEKLQRYSAELMQSNEELRNFTFIFSHDLRTPMVNIRGFSGELNGSLNEVVNFVNANLHGIQEKEHEKLRSVLQKDVPAALGFIDSSVRRMDALINSILTLSRLGGRELKPAQVNMEALARSILSSLASQLEQRRAKVTVGQLPEVVADRTSMKMILSNLLDNAVKYFEPGRDGKIEITAENGPEEATFHIRDNGRGIAGEDIDKIFDIFRRAGKQDVQGEGMGLAYVKTLVRRHGGRIWCESEPRKGSTFSFTISNKPEFIE